MKSDQLRLLNPKLSIASGIPRLWGVTFILFYINIINSSFIIFWTNSSACPSPALSSYFIFFQVPSPIFSPAIFPSLLTYLLREVFLPFWFLSSSSRKTYRFPPSMMHSTIFQFLRVWSCRFCLASWRHVLLSRCSPWPCIQLIVSLPSHLLPVFECRTDDIIVTSQHKQFYVLDYLYWTYYRWDGPSFLLQFLI